MNHHPSDHHHNKKMSTADHDWFQVLMQHRMQRSASLRGRNLAAPVSPSSERCLVRKQDSSARARLMSDSHVQESNHSRRSKLPLRRPTLDRRRTSATGSTSGHSKHDLDIPPAVSVRSTHSERQDAEDDMSEVSFDEEDEFGNWGQSIDLEDELKRTAHSSSGSFKRCQNDTANPTEVGVEPDWGITTLRIEDMEGSPMKSIATDDLPPMMLQLCALDDERQDYTTEQPTSSEEDISGGFVDEDRHEQPYLV